MVFIPKYRRKALYHELRRHLGEVFRALAEQKECRIEEGHLMTDHVHMLLSIPPKYSVAQVVGFIKGKRPSTLPGRSWDDARTTRDTISGLGVFHVSTVGRDEATIREYIRTQREKIDDWTKWICGKTPPIGGSQPNRFERFEQYLTALSGSTFFALRLCRRSLTDRRGIGNDQHYMPSRS